VGIDIHNLNLLAHARDLGVSFERTLAIGRQAVFIEDWELEEHRRLRGLPPLAEPPVPPGEPRYFEPLMQQWLGSAVADAVDASPYENARLIHDMNLPWPAEGPLAAERGQYDAVLDFGCLEHVFNFPVAWRNCIDLCRVGGVTPWMKVAGMAEAFNLPVVSHVVPEMHLHLIAAVPNGLTVEYMPWMLKLYEETPAIEKGQLVLPTKPGLGLKFDEKAVAAYRVG